MHADSPTSARPAISIRNRPFGGGRLFLIAGPCVLESLELTRRIAGELVQICRNLDVALVFKASYDKANRTSLGSQRGPGPERGLEWLAAIRQEFDVPVLTDVHSHDQCAPAAEAVDVLQIPAFLCRQTDLLLAAGATGRAVNIKKGQFLAPWDMRHVVEKVRSTGNPNVLATERGASFGYGRLVVDMAGFPDLAASGAPLVFDATHSVQQPGGADGKTGGDRSRVPLLARAAVATGLVDGLFMETHPEPEKSPSDGPNMVRLSDFQSVLKGCVALHRAARDWA
jgi:2-dehydro-3-deoxyphosphooctonate aldolase (KDO 8-P synthase)